MVSAHAVTYRGLNLADTAGAGLTEEQITEIFSGAGRVLNFRLVYDRETGRPKGFGFAEFPDYGAHLPITQTQTVTDFLSRFRGLSCTEP
jgi:hypothetical protein